MKTLYHQFARKAPVLSLLPLGLFLISCVPMTERYYRPSAPEGQVVRQACPPVDSVLLIDKNGVVISVKAVLSARKEVSVTLGFEVPKGEVVKLLDKEIASMLDGKLFSEGILSGRIWVSRGHTGDYSADSPMVGATENRFLWPGPYYGKTDHAYYWFTASLPIPEIEQFDLQLPDIAVNGARAQLPIIRFTRDERFHFAPLNC